MAGAVASNHCRTTAALRDAFILHKLHGSSYRDIAKLLDISESAVEKHIIKGLAHCRRRLGVHFNRPYRDS
uniref:sigma factor-like helix-turn-helix DNA-binding protein n=1 Tax=Methylomonas koyamae TaxID=702114 RepID=UPI003571484F